MIRFNRGAVLQVGDAVGDDGRMVSVEAVVVRDLADKIECTDGVVRDKNRIQAVVDFKTWQEVDDMLRERRYADVPDEFREFLQAARDPDSDLSRGDDDNFVAAFLAAYSAYKERVLKGKRP